MKECRECGAELVVDENWWPSHGKNNNCICIACAKARMQKYHVAHEDDWLISYRQREVIKHCRKCGDELVVDENWYASVAKHNDCICISCKKAYVRQYCQGHKEEVAAYKRQYREEHKEEMAAYKRQYYQEHEEKIVAYQSQYGRQWRKENPEKHREYEHRRRARKAGATIGEVNEFAVYDLYNSTCLYCGDKEDLTIDHIVPLNGGGPHCQDNLVIACRSCNASKSDTPLEEWIQMRPDVQVWLM